MKTLKNMSDELWIGLVLMVSAVWMFFLGGGYVFISGVLAIVAAFLIIIDATTKKEVKVKKNTKQKVKKK